MSADVTLIRFIFPCFILSNNSLTKEELRHSLHFNEKLLNKSKLFGWHNYSYLLFKGNAQFTFLCNPPKSSVNVCFMKKLKNTATKKVTVFL